MRLTHPQFVTLAAALVLLVGAVIGMPSVLAWVITAWYSFFGVGVYSHGYLVFGVALWMGWVYWRRNPPRELKPWWWGLLPLGVLVAGMAVMEFLFIGSSRALLLPPLFLASVALVYGPAAARRLLMPVCFVYFGLLPFWAFNPILQALATRAVTVLMALGEVPFFIDEFYIHIPAGTFEVASSCSGLSFLLSAVTLATLYSAVYLERWHSRVLLLAATILAALTSNWIRIWTLVLIGQATELQHWLIDDHYLYGWVLFILALGPVLFLARRLEDRELAQAEAAAKEGGKSATPSLSSRSGVPVAAPAPVMLLAALTGGLMLSLPRHLTSEIVRVGEPPPLTLPELAGTAQKMAWKPAEWRPDFHKARQDLAVYAFRDQHVDVMVAWFPEQDRERHLFLRRERDSVFSRQWLTRAHERVEIAVGEQRFRVNEVVGMLGSRQRVMIYWFEVADRPVTTRLGAKLAEAAALPRGRSDALALAVAVDCMVSCEAARELLREFVADANADFRAVR